MNRRLTIFLLCSLLPLLFMGCQTYTASKGKAAIAPITSVAEEKTITKYSVLQEEKEASLREKALQEQQEQAVLAEQQQAERDKKLATLKEKALQEQQEQAALVEQQQAEKDKKIAALEEKALQEQQEQAALVEQQQAEKDKKIAALTEREQKLENSLTALNNRLDKATEENQRLTDSLAELSLKKDEITLDTQLSSQESAGRIEQIRTQSAARIEELTQQNAQLTNQIFELQSLIEENKTLQQEQKAERQRLEQEQEDLLADQEKARLAAWQQLNDERDALASETRMLKAQLEEKTLTIEEKVRLEQLRSDEARKLEQERLARRMEQEAEEKRLASQEEAKRMALEKEWRQIPPLDQITYPRLYKTEKPTILAKEGGKLRALMLPLDDVPWKDSTVVLEVHKSISDLEVPIVFVTGHMENVIALVRQMRTNAVLFSTGAIITSFPIQETGTYGADIQYQDKKILHLMVANLPEYQVVQQFVQEENWQATQKDLTANRLAHLREMIGEGSPTVATLMGASLYEPSYRDWNTFSPVAYRQMDYLWPLSAFLENEGFYDTYRLTHFSEATNAGNTLVTPAWSERVDFIYSKKILPLESAMLIIGGESAPDEGKLSRFGILGTFLVP